MMRVLVCVAVALMLTGCEPPPLSTAPSGLALAASLPNEPVGRGVPDAGVVESSDDGGAAGTTRRKGPPVPFPPVDPSPWTSATLNYVSSVRLGNQRPLGAAAVSFAQYLNAMHNRVHPLFADSFLAVRSDWVLRVVRYDHE